MIEERKERAVLAGGCFWGMQDLIRNLPGVVSSRVGYTGGTVTNATYKNHEGHAEAIEVIFDSTLLSYRALLEFFFRIHDPTTLNRQGGDKGASYRSAIFYTSSAQKETAQALIQEISKREIFQNAIVTELSEASDFWEAEQEHQDYLQKHPQGYTCHFEREGWRL